MDTTSVTSIRIQTACVSASCTTRRMASAKNLIQPAWPSSTQEMIAIHSLSRSFYIGFPNHHKGRLNPRHNTLVLPRCSTKPGIDSNNATSRNPAIELDSNSMAQHLATPTSNPAHTPAKSKGLIFDLGPKNSWDSIEIGSPIVKRYIGDNEERWFMWYHGSSNADNSDRIGLAVSSNGVNWTRGSEDVRSSDAGVVMNCSKNWWAFDTESIRPSELVILSSQMYSSVYWLYYTGYSSEEVEISGISNILVENPERINNQYTKAGNHPVGKIVKSLPGLACSQDGRHWARIEGDQHSGALLDVGSGKEWDSLFIAAPHVVVHASDDIRMYYYSFDAENGSFALGVARSRDGIRWVKLGKIMGRGQKGGFDELGVKNACVLRNRKNGKYMMAYEGVAANGKRSIGLAVSPDGLKNWERLQEDPILEPAQWEGWDNKGVRSPCLIQMEDKVDEWRLYYVGVGEGGRTGIGMAISEGSKIRAFRRCSGFNL